MKNNFKKIISILIVVITIMTMTTLTTHAISLDYSGGSSSNKTGAGPTTSGFLVSFSDTIKNVCGYRFSVVSAAGTPKVGTHPVNVFLSNITEGNNAYNSAQRFIVSSGNIANKKQLANGTVVSSTATKQSCDYKSGECGFYSALPQNPKSVGDWIKNTTNNYQNLSRIYVLCGTNLAYASESDYVLIEPMFRPMLAKTRYAATATELALYGAAVSGGDQYNGANGNLYNAGTGTLWNIMNYMNREFPNALYVSSNTAIYNAVTVKTSGRYTYRQIIQSGFGCSVLTVKNVVPIRRVNIAYSPNGGTTDMELHTDGWIMVDGQTYIHKLNHGQSSAPYDADAFGMTRAGYTFKGWEIAGSGVVLEPGTIYPSTVYTQYNDPNITTANTETVYCHLYAVWEKALTDDIKIVPIDPNAEYRANTEVISSFWLVNVSDNDYIPSSSSYAVISIYDSGGNKIAEETQEFVVPKQDKNLAYMKWRVPEELGGESVTVTAYITDGIRDYSFVERNYSVISFDIFTTPKTSYTDKAPDEFYIPQLPNVGSFNARWWQWEYIGNSFVKQEYAVTNIVSNVILSAPTNPTAYTLNGTLYMKSGYGIECYFQNSLLNVDGYLENSVDECVGAQYYYALFPEFDYTYGKDKCRSFDVVYDHKKFVNSTGGGSQHFTPIYYPNGEYTFIIVLSDSWTPAGMIMTYKTVTIQIVGNMYDDWYIGRK